MISPSTIGLHKPFNGGIQNGKGASESIHPALRHSLENHLRARLDLRSQLDYESLAKDPDPRSAALARITHDEHRHAEILDAILQGFSARRHNDSHEPAFLNWIWRAFALHAELIGLIIPKIITRICFGYWAQHNSDPALRRTFAAIGRDLEAHVEIYIGKLREDEARLSTFRRRTLRVLGTVLFKLTALVMFIHHAPALHTHGITCARFIVDCGQAFEQALASCKLDARCRFQLNP